jgi:hypothetical protein
MRYYITAPFGPQAGLVHLGSQPPFSNMLKVFLIIHSRQSHWRHIRPQTRRCKFLCRSHLPRRNINGPYKITTRTRKRIMRRQLCSSHLLYSSWSPSRVLYGTDGIRDRRRRPLKRKMRRELCGGVLLGGSQPWRWLIGALRWTCRTGDLIGGRHA